MRLSRLAGTPARLPRWGALAQFVVPAVVGLVALGVLAAWHQAGVTTAAPVPRQEPGHKEFEIAAHKYAFIPRQIEVQQDDLIKITLHSEDIPHSFTIDSYRIAKRVNPGQTVIFEFRADQAGRFPFYCNLKIDDGCKAMRGELIVRPR